MAFFGIHDRKYQEKTRLSYCRGTKGVPVTTKPSGKYSLVYEEVSLPAAVINRQALAANMDWMQQFADHYGVSLCPHGKTTMTPHFFIQQKEKGAWGITVATAPQAEVAAAAGVEKILLANQLVGRANMAMIARIKRECNAQVIACVDCVENLDQLQAFYASISCTIDVLIEFGIEGGRCGCRTVAEVIALATYIKTLNNVSLVGIEVYEGVIHGGDEEARVRAFLQQTIHMARMLVGQGLLPDKPILTGAGSAWYDIVAEAFAHLEDFEAIIRPGCYAIHDTGIYLAAQRRVMARAEKNGGYAYELGGDLSSALEVWAYVLSRPEPTRAIVGLGKRDVAFDAGLPIAERAYRHGQRVNCGDVTAMDVMDQHTLLSISADSTLRVGDIIAFSTSHPCLTLDKWRFIAISDNEHNIEQWVETVF